MYKKLKGQGSVYALLALGGVIVLSFLVSGGILPEIKSDDKFDKVVSRVYLSSDDGHDGLQLRNIEFDPASVTVIPTPTLPVQQSEPQDQAPTLSLSPEPSSEATTPIPPQTTQTPATPGQATSTPQVTTTTPSSLPPLTSFQQRLLAIAKSQIGDPYGWGDCHNWSRSSLRPSNPPKRSDGCPTYDCSGFAGWVYYWATNGSFNMRGQTCRDFGNCYNYSGTFLPENPSLYTKFYTKDISKIRFGDIVYFGDIKNGKYYPTHVEIYTGPYGKCGANDCIIGSSGSGRGVKERSLSPVSKRMIGFLRPKL